MGRKFHSLMLLDLGGKVSRSLNDIASLSRLRDFEYTKPNAMVIRCSHFTNLLAA